MSLVDYRRKRRFDQTREPEPGKRVPAGQRPIFVVQLHHASRRHYDFRLQVGDALKSWAVPKGPSYDPDVKRMAVEVEDHPLDYADFEGEIPRGQYGGGHVAQFDHGVWTTDGDPEAQLAKGHLRFELFGQKLKGGWHLVRSGKPARQPQWLLFKEKDDFAGGLEADDLLADVAPAPESDKRRAGSGKKAKKGLVAVPGKSGRRRDWAKRAMTLDGAHKGKAPTGPFQPQLAKLGQMTPDGPQWLHEIKWDGYRILVTVEQGEVRLWSRNALEWTARLPDIRMALEGLRLTSAALDGELIAGRGTKEDFNLLQATLSGERQGRLALVLFDVLHLEGVEVANAPLRERKLLLQELLEGAPAHLAFSSHVEADGATAFRVAAEQHFEGVISKRADRAYHAGRSDDWRKTKQLASEEFAVVGYTAPKGGRTGFGSLLLASPDSKHGWRYVGRVGTGFDEIMLKQLTRRLAGGGNKPTAHVGTTETDLRAAKWFAPRFVVEVFYRGKGGQALLRQSSFKALRLDKDVDDLRDSDQPAAPKRKIAAAKRSRSGATRRSDQALPALSSPTKLLFPSDRISKQEVWDYYLAVSEQLLPEIVGRPLSVIRCPAGIERPCFFQKHMTAGLERVSTVKLKEESGASADYLVVDDLAGLMELVQFNALEFHPWGA
ncbi:MAG: non-homologous end-joining DNA ligase, partial [Stenotrophomonas sp.]